MIRLSKYSGITERKLIVFLYTSKEQVELEIKNIVIYINFLRNFYSSLKSNKIIKDLYEEIYKTLMKYIVLLTFLFL